MLYISLILHSTNLLADNEDAIDYSSVSETLEKLKKRPSSTISQQDGWSIVSLIAFELIVFTAVPLTKRNYPNRLMWRAWIRVALIRDMNRTHPPSTRRKAIHGGSTPASMRVMVVDKCVRFTPLAVNGTAVNCFIQCPSRRQSV